MLFWLRPLVVLLAAASTATAHFVFVVPQPGTTKAKVLMSETLEPDGDVDVSIIGTVALSARDAGGKETKVTLPAPTDHAYVIDLAGAGTGNSVVHGSIVLDVQQRGKGKPFLLTYHPKAILGDAFDTKATLGKDAAVAEIIPVGKAGELAFEVQLKGEPVADAKTTVILPDGTQKELATGKDGRTQPFKELGRFGVWARCIEVKTGEHKGKAYEESRHYPTLVIDTGAGGAAPAKSADAGSLKLPEAVSSFGAVATDGWLYVYGGHIAPTHHYDTKAVSGKFHRIKLDGGTTWEPLPGGPGLQGMNIVAYGAIFRVGGMKPVNAPGEEVDNRSVADVAAFNPATSEWVPFPSLPEPRSSHDVVVVGDKLIVVGGWNMKGAEGNEWLKTALVLNLANLRPEWTPIPQPFQRRALIAAVHNGKVFVIGGFDEHDDPSLEVQVYDPASGAWTTGPNLPGRKRNGFAPAACVLDGRLYVSVGDGSLNRLDDAAGKWEQVAKTTPRIVHRLVPHKGEILVLGGADRNANYDLIETVRPTPGAVVESRAE